VIVYLAFATAPLAWVLGGEHLTPWLLLPWLSLPIAAPIVRTVRNRVDGPSLNGALARTDLRVRVSRRQLRDVEPAARLSRQRTSGAQTLTARDDETLTTMTSDAPIRQLSAPDLKALLESGTAIELVDVRTHEERAIAAIAGSRLLDQAYHDALFLRDRDTPLVFQCHHGVRSQHAAEYFREQGFRNLYNLRGGIDAWSLQVDPSVPRY